MKFFKRQLGVTLVEMVIAVCAIAWLAFIVWVLSLCIRALLKYLGS